MSHISACMTIFCHAYVYIYIYMYTYIYIYIPVIKKQVKFIENVLEFSTYREFLFFVTSFIKTTLRYFS